MAGIGARKRRLSRAMTEKRARWAHYARGPDGDEHSAEEIHAMTLTNLNGEFARIVSASEAIAALEPG
jgi:hypothetical protein